MIGRKYSLWESPIYKFRIPINDQSNNLKEITIDVTKSAPSFEEVLDTMKSVFDELLKSDEGKQISSLVDVGAAKFRNTLYFLKKGKKVSGVEFETLTKTSEQAKRILAECKKLGFKDPIFPHKFIKHESKYDLALLINVPPVMPIYAERLFLLQVLYDKVKDGRYLLWYAQHEGSYKKIRESNKQNIGDGIWMGKDNRYKTFFRYHNMFEINEMMFLSGFEPVKRFSAPGNDVHLYKKNDYNLFSKILTQRKIEKEISIDETIEEPKVKLKKVRKGYKTKPIVPNPPFLSITHLYKEALKTLQPGIKDAEHYHRLASLIVNRIFNDSLRNMELKQETQRSTKIIDTVYRNSAEKGFFHSLQSSFNIKCPYIIMEAKNYNYDPENPEFDQLSGRLNKVIGKFGILVCRKIEDKTAMMKKCEGYLDDEKYVVTLTDNDLTELLDLRDEGNIDEINDFMDEKIKPFIFRTSKK